VTTDEVNGDDTSSSEDVAAAKTIAMKTKSIMMI